MDQAPIDIRYAELLIWLEGRYLIPKDWAKRLELINVKKSEFFEDLFKKDTTEMKKIQESFKSFRNVTDTMSFNDVMRLNTLLLKTEEAKSKTLFGYHTSQLIKDSNLLVEIYKKNNVHLAESSKLIIQNIGYEIPNLEKNTLYNERTIYDYESKINEKNLQIEKNKSKITELFKRYDIKDTQKTNDIAINLINRLSHLENSLRDVESALMDKTITETIQIYQNFYKMIFNQNLEDFDPNLMCTLKRVNKEGDYFINDDKTNSSDKYKIIQSKIEEYKQKYENLDIQADIEAQIWNFKLVNDTDTQGKDDSKNSVTVLLNNQTMRQIINDLDELLIFITHRLTQMNNKDEINLAIYQDNLRKINLEMTPELLQSSKKYLENLLNRINNPDLKFLLNIFEDEKNIKLILNTFELIRTENKKLDTQVADLKIKIEEIKKEIIDNKKKTEQFKKEAKLVKKQMEKFLIDTLKRKITIIGDINLLT